MLTFYLEGMNQWYIVRDGGRIVRMFMGDCLRILCHNMLMRRICIALDTGCVLCFLFGVGVCMVGGCFSRPCGALFLDREPMIIVLGMRYGYR